jgi:hypothetical protein
MIIRHKEVWVAPTLLDLIEGIYDQFPIQSRLLLRRRIILSSEPSIFERALIQVCAKRFETVTHLPDLSNLQVHEVKSPPLDHAQGLGIYAWLLDSRFTKIAEAKNTHSQIKTRHAEMNLLLKMRQEGKLIPKDTILISTLKPCAMCAALIWEMAEDLKRLQIIYLENDPGPWGQNTILTEGSPARTRYLEKNSEEFKLKIQFSAHELPRKLLLSLMTSNREIHEFTQKLGITNP